jgi:hypothetical protein
MSTLLMRHQVTDFDGWFAGFTSHESLRTSHGATSHRVFQDGDTVVVSVDFPDEASVAAFRADPALAEAMKQAGVISVPEVQILTEVDARSY